MIDLFGNTGNAGNAGGGGIMDWLDRSQVAGGPSNISRISDSLLGAGQALAGGQGWGGAFRGASAGLGNGAAPAATGDQKQEELWRKFQEWLKSRKQPPGPQPPAMPQPPPLPGGIY